MFQFYGKFTDACLKGRCPASRVRPPSLSPALPGEEKRRRATEPRKVALASEKRSVLRAGRLTVTVAPDSSALRVCMERRGHGLHQENQDRGVDVRDPERHDQHRVPAVRGLGH
ncbi:hypothetical protein AGIG_G22546 [Arapaima gigas]